MLQIYLEFEVFLLSVRGSKPKRKRPSPFLPMYQILSKFDDFLLSVRGPLWTHLKRARGPRGEKAGPLLTKYQIYLKFEDLLLSARGGAGREGKMVKFIKNLNGLTAQKLIVSKYPNSTTRQVLFPAFSALQAYQE